MPGLKSVPPKHNLNSNSKPWKYLLPIPLLFYYCACTVHCFSVTKWCWATQNLPPDASIFRLKDICHKLAWKKQSHCCGEGGTRSGLAPGAALSEVSSTQAPVVYAADRCGMLHVIGATLIHSFGIMWWITILTDASLEEAPKGQISLFHVHENYIPGHP